MGTKCFIVLGLTFAHGDCWVSLSLHLSSWSWVFLWLRLQWQPVLRFLFFCWHFAFGSFFDFRVNCTLSPKILGQVQSPPLRYKINQRLPFFFFFFLRNQPTSSLIDWCKLLRKSVNLNEKWFFFLNSCPGYIKRSIKPFITLNIYIYIYTHTKSN